MVFIAKRVYNHYEIYVNDEFYCSCDVEELNETLDEIRKEMRKDLHLEMEDV